MSLALTLVPSFFAAGTRAGASSAELTQYLLKHKAATLHAWNTHNASVRPLDLKLDQYGNAYQVDNNGFLQPLGDENYQQEYEVVVDVGQDENIDPPLSQGVKPNEDSSVNKEYSSVSRKLDSIVFEHTEENDPSLEEDAGKRKGGGKKDDDSGKKGRGKGGRGKRGGKDNSSSSNNSSDSEVPIIKGKFPAENTVVGENFAFGALVTDSSKVVEVCVQLKDHMNKLSDCYEATHVGNGIYEVTFEGFGDYGGKTWSYRVRGKDNKKNRETTEWIQFVIDDGGSSSGGRSSNSSSGSGKSSGGKSGANENSDSGSSSGSGNKLTAAENDESWPYGGIVQRSTGRILFFFNGEAFVCTGTIVGDKVQDRTVILTAAHCAYEYGKGFAEHALFIPDQDSTTGSESDEACSNDPFGCWIAAFAVVDQRWTLQAFPDTVPYDYAFYVIPNDVSAHEKGYKHIQDPGLSELLPDIAEHIPLDWKYDRHGEFITGLGYSFDKDPDFRYCSGTLSGKRGLPSYENLWIGNCEMTGGSSGGPWMKETDENGRGTVVSVNSWGYTGSPGMGGPNLSTGEAKCLYEKAKTRSLSLSVSGGYIVTDCANN